MTGPLNVSALESSFLSLKLVGENDFQVRVGDTPVGEIMLRRRSFGRSVWFWSLSGPHIPETMSAAGSNAQTFEGAKLAIKRCFDAWLHSETGQPGNMNWEKSLHRQHSDQ